MNLIFIEVERLELVSLALSVGVKAYQIREDRKANRKLLEHRRFGHSDAGRKIFVVERA
jgi:thiamine monophosphate synthase